MKTLSTLGALVVGAAIAKVMPFPIVDSLWAEVQQVAQAAGSIAGGSLGKRSTEDQNLVDAHPSVKARIARIKADAARQEDHVFDTVRVSAKRRADRECRRDFLELQADGADWSNDCGNVD